MSSKKWEHLPGGARVEAGIKELVTGKILNDGWLVLLAATRLRGLGIAIPKFPNLNPEDELYKALELQYGDDAHQQFNAMRREIVSFVEALESRQRHL